MSRTLDTLLSDPRAVVSALVYADPQSFVPVAHQRIGDYVLNDSGVHHLIPDADGDLVADTVYPVPFIAAAGDANVILHFFTQDGQVETVVHLDTQTTEAFRSLSVAEKEAIVRFISVCLMSTC